MCRRGRLQWSGNISCGNFRAVLNETTIVLIQIVFSGGTFQSFSTVCTEAKFRVHGSYHFVSCTHALSSVASAGRPRWTGLHWWISWTFSMPPAERLKSTPRPWNSTEFRIFFAASMVPSRKYVDFSNFGNPWYYFIKEIQISTKLSSVLMQPRMSRPKFLIQGFHFSLSSFVFHVYFRCCRCTERRFSFTCLTISHRFWRIRHRFFSERACARRTFVRDKT